MKHVYITGFTATPEHRGVRKTALGAETSVPWSYHTDPLVLLDVLKKEGMTIAALERTVGAVSVGDAKAGHFPMALILGNEVTGVPPELIEASDMALALPQFGLKDSLNVSVAFGIAAYGLVGLLHSFNGAKP